MPTDTLWDLEPHTKAKHEILRRYLGAWFAIMDQRNSKLLYLDGFCGPGEYNAGEPGSPVIALEVASNHDKPVSANTVFWFIDNHPARIEHLKKRLGVVTWPPNFSVDVDCGEFVDVFRARHDVSSPDFSLPPTFAFLDPFGFSGMPFDLIARMLQCPKCEAFINLSVDSINRFLEHPESSIRQHILDAFGTEEVMAIPELHGDRIEAFRLLYQKQLEGVAEYVRFFEMRDRRNHVPYYLFFATNHPLGFEKMKEAMWMIDPDGEFTFSDRTNPFMETMFNVDCTNEVAELLSVEFSGIEDVLTDVVLEHVVNQTSYVGKHARAALVKLEQDERIAVSETKADGKPRKKGTFPPGVILSFVPRDIPTEDS